MKWIPTTAPDPAQVAELKTALGVPKTIAHLLCQRGIQNFDTAKTFFRPELSHLHEPLLMQDMQVAVDRILKAKEQNETVMVYGDYDVDGTSAVALMTSFLKNSGLKVHYYIPDRYTEGYGLSKQGVETAKEYCCGLLIALDCGIKAFASIDTANALGIDVIVCDHHLPEERLPKALAVLDPKRPDCSYPYKELCGCGIGFKLIQAVTYALGGTIEELTPYLDLTAIAIAADIVPMTGENRVLTYYGLQYIQKHPRPGIAPILKQVKGPLTVTDLVFKIAPRINAAGRIKHGKEAVALFLETNPENAIEKGNAIETYNTSRRAIDEKTTQEALAQIKAKSEEHRFSTVVWQEEWHKGVLGIVASRLIETYYRPTIVLAKNGANFTGSVRSIKGFDVHEALTKCGHFLTQYGGHQYAAGLTLVPDQLEAFKAAFESCVQESLKAEDLVPSKKYDALVQLEELHPKFFRILNQMQPFGPQNMRPVFRTKGCSAVQIKQVGDTKAHLKLLLKDASGTQANAIAFGWGGYYEQLQGGVPFEILYVLEENHFQGIATLQLQIKDLKIEA